MICVIFNHNCNENAEYLLDMFSKDMYTVVLDSGSSIENNRFNIMGNIYYCGMLNEAVKIMNKKKSNFITYITSDVKIDEYNYEKLLKSFKNMDGIGSYCPSVDSASKSHYFCENSKSSGLRDVSFNEGYMSVVRSEIINKVVPIDTSLNKHGFGVDMYTGYICKKLGFRCVIDDSIIIHHPIGTGYDVSEASCQMVNYINHLNDFEFNDFIRNCHDIK